jgi:hypothetical protein
LVLSKNPLVEFVVDCAVHCDLLGGWGVFGHA